MCTAISYHSKQHYFGRNLDIERNYQEKVIITPRQYVFRYRFLATHPHHYAIIGIGVIMQEYPLYFDATNEKGVSIAGLNFPHNAHYYDYRSTKENVAPFELIPYILGTCSSIVEVKKLLRTINIVHCNFSDTLPVTPLHWMICDRECSIVLECTKEGMKVYEDPYGVLTNNPTFDYHLMNIHNYMSLQEGSANNTLVPNKALVNYSLGMGALGLPGDFSSASRFVKAVFMKEKSVCGEGEKESVDQFFHILLGVAMPKGCVRMPNGEYEYTRYSSCCNTDTKVYYYMTYEDLSIRNVSMYTIDLDSDTLYEHPIT
ncbi:MAG: choloylglycine hydrolase [Erysipelotrichales bacterium]|nr:choloylglycine hydrolase [Erysipelotrichales bacterium]